MNSKLYEVKMRVSFVQEYQIFADNEDEAIEWAEKEANLDAPSDVWIDTDILTINTIDRNTGRDDDD